MTDALPSHEGGDQLAHGVVDPAALQALSAYVKLLRAARAVSLRIDKKLACDGLTTTQLGVLEAVLHLGPLTQRELGQKVLTSAGNMTDVVNKLEARDLVRRVRDEADHRMIRVQLTTSGRGLIEELFPRHAADIADAMAGLNRRELERLGDLLRTLGMAAARAA